MDGSQKLPQRLLGTISDNIAANRDISGLALAVAGWMRYATGTDERGNPIDVRDPLAGEFRARTAGKTSAPALLQAYLGMEQIFGSDLPESTAFCQAVGKALTELMDEGAARTVAGFCGGAKALAI